MEALKVVGDAMALFKESGEPKAGWQGPMINLHCPGGPGEQAFALTAETIEFKQPGEKKLLEPPVKQYLVDALTLAAAKDGEVSAKLKTIKDSIIRGDFDEAKRGANDVVASPPKGGKQLALLLLANVQLATGYEKEALKTAVEARKGCREAKDQRLEIAVMQSVTTIYLAKHDMEQALRSNGAIKSLYTKLGDKAGLAGAMCADADIYIAFDKFDQAAAAANEATATYKAAGNKIGEVTAKCLACCGTLLKNSANAGTDALKLANEALALAKAAGDSFGEANAVHLAAQANMSKADTRSGVMLAQQAVDLFKAWDKRSWHVGNAYQTLATGHLLVNENKDEATEAARNATVMFMEVADKWATNFAAETCAFTQRMGVGLAAKAIEPAKVSKLTKEQVTDATRGRKKVLRGKTGVPQCSHEASCALAPQHSVFWSQGLSDGHPTQWCSDLCHFVICMAQSQTKIPILLLTRGCYSRLHGQYIGSKHTDGSALTLWGIIRTVKLEMPSVHCDLVDFSGGESMSDICKYVYPKAVGPEVAIYHGGVFTPRVYPVPSLYRRDKGTGGGGIGKDGKPQFIRKQFSWMGANHKLDHCWWSQQWVCQGLGYDENALKNPSRG